MADPDRIDLRLTRIGHHGRDGRERGDAGDDCRRRESELPASTSTLAAGCRDEQGLGSAAVSTRAGAWLDTSSGGALDPSLGTGTPI